MLLTFFWVDFCLFECHNELDGDGFVVVFLLPSMTNVVRGRRRLQVFWFCR